MSMYSYCMFMYLHRASWHSSATLIEVFPSFFLSCKANAMVSPTKTGLGPNSSKIFVLFYVLFVVCRSAYCVCKCVLYCCHRVAIPNYSQRIFHILSTFQTNIIEKSKSYSLIFYENLAVCEINSEICI